MNSSSKQAPAPAAGTAGFESRLSGGSPGPPSQADEGKVRDGLVAGLMASVPQVGFTQVQERLLGLPPERGEIGPRFVQRLADRLEAPLPPIVHWTLAGVFHFVYAMWWGGLYGLVQRKWQIRPLPGALGLAGLIYLVAFSRVGAGTWTGSEPPPEQRGKEDWAIHWTPALSFALVTAYSYEWLRGKRNGRG